MENKKKTIKAVDPYYHSAFLNFKMAPFKAWCQNGGLIATVFLSAKIFTWSYISLGSTYIMEK